MKSAGYLNGLLGASLLVLGGCASTRSPDLEATACLSLPAGHRANVVRIGIVEGFASGAHPDLLGLLSPNPATDACNADGPTSGSPYRVTTGSLQRPLALEGDGRMPVEVEYGNDARDLVGGVDAVRTRHVAARDLAEQLSGVTVIPIPNVDVVGLLVHGGAGVLHAPGNLSRALGSALPAELQPWSCPAVEGRAPVGRPVTVGAATSDPVLRALAARVASVSTRTDSLGRSLAELVNGSSLTVRDSEPDIDVVFRPPHEACAAIGEALWIPIAGVRTWLLVRSLPEGWLLDPDGILRQSAGGLP